MHGRPLDPIRVQLEQPQAVAVHGTAYHPTAGTQVPAPAPMTTALVPDPFAESRHKTQDTTPSAIYLMRCAEAQPHPWGEIEDECTAAVASSCFAGLIGPRGTSRLK